MIYFHKTDLINKQFLIYIVVKIPKDAILSIKTTGIANILEDESLEGGCSLALALMYEISQKTESPWYGYLQALPIHEDLPIFWSDEEKSLFKGTEMEHAVYNDLVIIIVHECIYTIYLSNYILYVLI